MLDTKILDIKNILNKLDPMVSRKVLAISVGISEALKTQLPSNEVGVLNSYFDNILMSTVKEGIFKLNEQIVIDVDLALDTARKYWSVRYNTLHPNKNLIHIHSDADVFDRLSGIVQFFSSNEYEFIVSNTDVITQLILKLD